jgi:hypothetical protein
VLKSAIIALVVLACAILFRVEMQKRQPQPDLAATGAQHCTTPEYREFDFFTGDWDAYDASDSTKIVARNHVTPMLDGCAIREVYSQNDGLRGESFSTYDASRRVWHQSWVTNHGQLLLLDGGLEHGNMVFTATVHEPDSTTSLIRATWSPLQNSVRETAVSSADGGKTWNPVFDLIFRPHK